jgi:DNA-binding MarR family transcriptional regulator
MEFEIQSDGSVSERSIRELAEWYGGENNDAIDFEAHLLLFKAYSVLVSSAQRGRRTLLGVERFALLRLLYRQPDHRMQMTEIGRALGVSPTSITKLVNRLITLKLVERTPHESDRRRAWVQLTERGVKLIQENLPSARASTRDRWKGLTPDEKRTLAGLLAKLIMTQTAPLD